MNWFDYSILAILALSVLVGLWRGFVSEVLALVCWVLAFWLAWMFGPVVAELFSTSISTPSVRIILGYTLCFIGVLMMGAIVAFLMRKLNDGRAFGQAGPMRIVAQLMISARERVVLLEIGEQWIVVGVVPGQIKTLHTLPKGELPAGKDAEGRFGVWLKHMAERKNENT